MTGECYRERFFEIIPRSAGGYRLRLLDEHGDEVGGAVIPALGDAWDDDADAFSEALDKGQEWVESLASSAGEDEADREDRAIPKCHQQPMDVDTLMDIIRTTLQITQSLSNRVTALESFVLAQSGILKVPQPHEGEL